MTFYVISEEEKFFVEITPQIKSGYAVGTHVVYRDNCTLNIMVINNGEYIYK